jgi:hypothetical protein
MSIATQPTVASKEMMHSYAPAFYESRNGWEALMAMPQRFPFSIHTISCMVYLHLLRREADL